MNYELALAKIQRYKALLRAFETIDEFATPSLSPEEYDNFEQFKKQLEKQYRPGKKAWEYHNLKQK